MSSLQPAASSVSKEKPAAVAAPAPEKPKAEKQEEPEQAPVAETAKANDEEEATSRSEESRSASASARRTGSNCSDTYRAVRLNRTASMRPSRNEFASPRPSTSAPTITGSLFRFRVGGDHWAARLGWLAGVAGPFVRKEAPTIQALGDTHSAYRPWDDKGLDEHVSDVRQLMKAWRERHMNRDE